MRRFVATAATTALVAGSAFLAPLANAADPSLATYTMKDQGVTCQYLKGSQIKDTKQDQMSGVMAVSTDPVASTVCLAYEAPVSLDAAQKSVQQVWKNLGNVTVVQRTDHKLLLSMNGKVAGKDMKAYAAIYTDSKITAETVWSYTDAKLDGTRTKAIDAFYAQFDSKGDKVVDKGDKGHMGDKVHMGDKKDDGRGVPAKTGDN